jgi:hypothetical protein
MLRVKTQIKMNEPIFTRYLYVKAEVINSLEWSILDKHLDESLFWAYELYFSGFHNETFDFLLSFCNKYNSEIYTHYYIYIKDLYKEWIQKKDDSMIGTIVNLLIQSKISLTKLLRIIQGVQTKKEKKEDIYIQKFSTQRFSEKQLHKYKTLKLTDKMHNWSFLDQIACKYCVRRVLCIELSLLYPTMEPVNFDKWMDQASKTPIWRQRILKFNGSIDDKTQYVTINNEKFFEQYDYEPDEQSKELKKMLWGNSIENYENISTIDFCKKYGTDNVYIKRKIITSKKIV